MTFLLLSILQTLVDWDTAALLWLNGWHSDYWDNFMEMCTGRFVWVPFYVSFVYAMYRRYHWRACMVCVLAALALLLVNDQLCSSVIRHVIGRLRPSNPANPLSGVVHLVDCYRSGRYGFPSAHATNSWGLAFFMMFVFRRRALSVTMALWATLLCYSRVYLGVHYPGDLLAGMLLGLVNASVVAWLLSRYDPGCQRAFAPCRTDAVSMRLPIAVCAAEVGLMLVLAFFVDPACKW